MNDLLPQLGGKKDAMCCGPTKFGEGEILSPQKKGVGGSRRVAFAQGGKENPLSPNSEPPYKKKGMFFYC